MNDANYKKLLVTDQQAMKISALLKKPKNGGTSGVYGVEGLESSGSSTSQTLYAYYDETNKCIILELI